MNIKKRLEELRTKIRNENISYDELIELQSLIKHIDLNDVELLELLDKTIVLLIDQYYLSITVKKRTT